VIELLATNLVLIASVADIFSVEVGKTCCCCGFGRAVFWLFGNTDIDISASGAIGVDCVEKADPLLYSRSNDTGPVHLLKTDLVAFLSMLLRRFLFGECKRQKQSECTYYKEELAHFDPPAHRSNSRQ